MVAHKRAHQIRLECNVIICGKIVQTIARKNITKFIVKRKIELGVEQIIANIFIQKTDVPRECFANHIKHNARVGKKGIGGGTQILDELNGNVFDGIYTETINPGFLDKPHGMFHHQLAGIGIVKIDIGQIRRKPTRFGVIVPVVVVVAQFARLTRAIKPVLVFCIHRTVLVDMVGGKIDEHTDSAFVTCLNQSLKLLHRTKMRLYRRQLHPFGLCRRELRLIVRRHKRRHRPIRMVGRITVRVTIGSVADILSVHRHRRYPQRVDAKRREIPLLDFLFETGKITAIPVCRRRIRRDIGFSIIRCVAIIKTVGKRKI